MPNHCQESTMSVTRGFKGRGRGPGSADDRIPPGQHATGDFPILSAGPTPRTPLEKWSLQLESAGRVLGRWSWQEFRNLPQTDFVVDIHCVTKWTKLDTRWRGVTLSDLMKSVGIEAPPQPFVMAHCDGGYSTNLPVEDLLRTGSMVATHFDGAPLADVHGGPSRLLVPHLYFWKSAKWLRRLVFMPDNVPGFWESLGYHMYGDPWREQRYSGDE